MPSGQIDFIDRKPLLVNHIGIFDYGKASWLEYTYKMDQLFNKSLTYNDEEKKEVCLAAMGGKTVRVLKSIIHPRKLPESIVTYDYIVKALTKHFYPEPDVSFYISKFTLRHQWARESFFDYVSVLRKLIVDCRFSKKGEASKLRNQLVNGVQDYIKKEINANSMSLSQIFEIGLKSDNSRYTERHKQKNHGSRKRRLPKCFRCGQYVKNHKEPQSCPFEWAVCSNCGIKGHLLSACKYKEVECNLCKTIGHIAKLCKKKIIVQKTASVGNALEKMDVEKITPDLSEDVQEPSTSTSTTIPVTEVNTKKKRKLTKKKSKKNKKRG